MHAKYADVIPAAEALTFLKSLKDVDYNLPSGKPLKR